MSDKKAIIILKLIDELPSFVDSFLQLFDCEFVDAIPEDKEVHVAIAPSVAEIDFSKVTEKTLVLVEEVAGVDDKNTANIMGLALLEYPFPQKLALRFLCEDTSLQVEEEFSTDNVKKFDGFKLTDHHQAGFYCDLTALTSLRNGFNFVSIRLYLTYLMTFFSYLKQANQIRLPVDFDLAGDENTFMIQAHCEAKDFNIDSLKQALTDRDLNNPSQGLIKGSSRYCHMVDFYFLEKTSRLVVTSLWINAGEKTLAPAQGSLFKVFQQLSGSNSSQGAVKNVLSNASATDAEKEQVLPGKGYAEPVTTESPTENTLDMSKSDVIMAGDLNRMVDYILSENDNGIVTYKKKYFDKEMVGWFLAAYPDQRKVSMLQDKNYEYILNCIKDENYLEKVKQKASEYEPAEIADKVADTLNRTLKDEEFINDLNAKRAEEGKDELDVEEIADSISDEIKNSKDEFETIQEIQDKAESLVKEKLDIPDAEVQEMIDRVMLESIQDYIDALEQTTDEAKVDKKFVVKMMKVIQALKNKILELEEGGTGGGEGGSSIELAELRKKVSSHESNLENKEKIIKELNSKLEGLKGEGGSDSGGGEDGDESDMLKQQIRSLESQLELYQERVSVLSNKLDKTGDKGDMLFKGNQNSGLSDSVLQNKVSALEGDNKKLELGILKIEEAKNKEIQKLKEELHRKKAPVKREKSDDAKVLELKRENKKVSDELKNVKLQSKSFQQKLKHAQKQVERLQSKQNAVGNKGKSKATDAKSALRIKQLEALNEKAKKKAQKVEKELSTRKAQLSKMKQEMGAMRNKMDEMQRKLGKGKKAA